MLTLKDLPPLVRSWVEEMALFTGADPARIRVVEEADDDGLLAEAVEAQEILPLADGNYYARSHPEDVARSEERTFIATPHHDDQGLYNNWRPEAEIRPQVEKRVKGSYAGQTMYVIPYLMGPSGSDFSQVGVQITNSRYVVLNMIRMTQVGRAALKALNASDHFVKGVHATGDLSQVRRGQVEEEDDRYFVSFPASREIWSFGSAYGGNALLSKKFHSLRQAGYDAWKEAERGRFWLAEHMMILGIEDRQTGRTRYVTGAFPSASGKTNLAMMVPPSGLGGRYRTWLVGDDIAWLFVGKDGTLRAINPENGFFGVAPGTNEKTNPMAMKTIGPGTKTLFTNVAFNPKTQEVWWEGKTDKPPGEGWLDWKGEPWSPASGKPAAHPNSRFTAFAKNAPNLSAHWRDPEGVPVSAILFGGRLLKGEPLVRQLPDPAWGVYDGAVMGVETTAAAAGKVGVFRPDPMAMRPFFSYPETAYSQHWLDVMDRLGKNAPGFFHVNWFRKDGDGRFLWPGFGENLRVLLWALDRVEGKGKGVETPIGFIPPKEELPLEGLDIPRLQLDKALAYDAEHWSQEAQRRTEWLASLKPQVPPRILRFHERFVRAVASEHPAALDRALI